MTLAPAPRLALLEPSAIRAVRRRAIELEASGRSIVHFEIGEPDFDSPPEAKAAAVAALEAGKVHYTANHGEPELLAAISEKLARDNDLHYDPAGEIVVTTGGAEGLLDTTMRSWGRATRWSSRNLPGPTIGLACSWPEGCPSG